MSATKEAAYRSRNMVLRNPEQKMRELCQLPSVKNHPKFQGICEIINEAGGVTNYALLKAQKPIRQLVEEIEKNL